MTSDSNDNERRAWVLAALEQHEGRLTRYAMRILGDEASARDAVQHAFLRLCDQQPSELNGRLAAWLYAVCRNKALDQVRRSGRCGQLERTDSDCLAGRELDPAEAIERQDLAGWLRLLMDSLPAHLREVLDLWLDGLSYDEMADITQQTNGHIRVLVHRALTRLREHPRTRKLLDNEAPPKKSKARSSS